MNIINTREKKRLELRKKITMASLSMSNVNDSAISDVFKVLKYNLPFKPRSRSPGSVQFSCKCEKVQTIRHQLCELNRINNYIRPLLNKYVGEFQANFSSHYGKEKFEDLTDTIKALQISIARQDETNHILEMKNKHIQDLIEEANKQLKTENQLFENLTNELKKYKDELDSKTKILDERKVQKSKIEQQLDEIQKELTYLSYSENIDFDENQFPEINEKAAYLQTLNQKIELLTKQKQEISTELNKRKNQIQKMNEKQTQFRNEIQTLKSANATSKSKVQKLKSKYESNL